MDIATPNSSLDTFLRFHNSSGLVAQDHNHIKVNAITGQAYWLQVRAGGEGATDDISGLTTGQES